MMGKRGRTWGVTLMSPARACTWTSGGTRPALSALRTWSSCALAAATRKIPSVCRPGKGTRNLSTQPHRQGERRRSEL